MVGTLKDRLGAIQRLERELVEKVHQRLPKGPVFMVDMFLMGAARRTLAQSRGFRHLIESRNFPSATILLRTQIDTAMRINGLSLMDDVEGNLKKVMYNEVRFDQLKTGIPKDGGKVERLTDAYLRKKLVEKYPWIDLIYNDASDFVHLSFRHLWTAISHTDDDMAYIAISGTDPQRAESTYYEVCDAFFKISQMTSLLILAVLMMVHEREEVAASVARFRADT